MAARHVLYSAGETPLGRLYAARMSGPEAAGGEVEARGEAGHDDAAHDASRGLPQGESAARESDRLRSETAALPTGLASPEAKDEGLLRPAFGLAEADAEQPRPTPPA